MIHRAFNILAGAAAFVATSAGLHRALPFPEVEQITPKLRFLEKHGRDYDAIFVGSSRIYREISPAVFDEEVARSGRRCRSFNFGIDAMQAPERFLVLEKILALPRVKPRWVFLEFDEIQARIPPEQESQRAVYWHDAQSTDVILRRLLSMQASVKWGRTLRRARAYGPEIRWHLQAFLRQEFNLGRATDLMLSWTRRNRLEPPLIENGLGDAGFIPLDGQISGADLEVYAGQVASMSQPQLERIDADTQRSYARCVTQIRAAGAVPILVVTPIAGRFPRMKFDRSPPAPLLAFNSVEHYPDLYRPEIRINAGHLNRAGAEEFTRLLAAEFIRQIPPP